MLKHSKNYCEYLGTSICLTLHLELLVKVNVVQTEVTRSNRETQITACKEK